MITELILFEANLSRYCVAKYSRMKRRSVGNSDRRTAAQAHAQSGYGVSGTVGKVFRAIWANTKSTLRLDDCLPNGSSIKETRQHRAEERIFPRQCQSWKDSSNRLRKKSSRLKSALRGRSYIVENPCSVGAHAPCCSRKTRSYSDLREAISMEKRYFTSDLSSLS